MKHIRFNCPHCGQSLSAAPEYSGSNIDCPVCNTPFVAFDRNRVVSPSKAPTFPAAVGPTVHAPAKIEPTIKDKIIVLFVLIGTILVIVALFRYWQYILNAIIVLTIGVTCWASISGALWMERNRALRRNRDFALSREQRLKLFYQGSACFLLAVALAWPTLARLMPDTYMPNVTVEKRIFRRLILPPIRFPVVKACRRLTKQSDNYASDSWPYSRAFLLHPGRRAFISSRYAAMPKLFPKWSIFSML